MIEEFAGVIAEHYAKYRRGYRTDVLDLLTREFDLDGSSRVLDLGCGTGQLTLPLAARAGAVIGMDPSPDMLALGRATEVPGITWVLGADSDVPALESLLGRASLDLVTIGQALHWMDAATLFAALTRLLRPGGGIAVIANGAPAWTLDTSWAPVLRAAAQKWFNASFPTCGTSEQERAQYRELLAQAGFTAVREHHFDYTEQLDLDEVVGSFHSAAPLERLSEGDRFDYDRELRQALLDTEPGGTFTEVVAVRVLSASWEPGA
jgi:trans-aconitate methyltransferase